MQPRPTCAPAPSATTDPPGWALPAASARSTAPAAPSTPGRSPRACPPRSAWATLQHRELQPGPGWGCNGTGAQQRTVAAGSTLQVLGKCLDVNGAGTADGITADLYDCDGPVRRSGSRSPTGPCSTRTPASAWTTRTARRRPARNSGSEAATEPTSSAGTRPDPTRTPRAAPIGPPRPTPTKATPACTSLQKLSLLLPHRRVPLAAALAKQHGSSTRTWERLLAQAAQTLAQ